MRRLATAIVICGVIAGVGGTLAYNASARVYYFRCAKVFKAGTGVWTNSACNAAGAPFSFVKALVPSRVLGMGQECAKTIHASESLFRFSNCTGQEEPKAYTEVVKPALGFPFAIKSGKTVFKIFIFTITCQKDKGTAKLVNPGVMRVTSVTFEECKLGTKSCLPAETKELTGDLGEVAEGEATDKTGIDLKPKVGTTIAEFSCEGEKVVLKGSVAGEIRPFEELSETLTIKFTPAAEKGEKIKKITLTYEEEEKEKTEAVEPKLELGTTEASMESEETATSEEKELFGLT
jgi:hypothetical protein